MMIRRFASIVAVAFVSIAPLALSIADTAFAQTHTAIHDGWRISIDESPSPEFIVRALADLQEYFKPYEVIPNLPWCCYVGNYGGVIESSGTEEDEIPFFRLSDDLFEEGTSFGIFWSSMLRNEEIFFAASKFNLSHGSPTELMTHLRAAIVPNFDPIRSGAVAYLKWDEILLPSAPIDPSYDPTNNDFSGYFKWDVGDGVYPVYVGRVGLQHLSPVVWSVTLSAAPEPSSAVLCLITATMFGLRLRRARFCLRPQVA